MTIAFTIDGFRAQLPLNLLAVKGLREFDAEAADLFREDRQIALDRVDRIIAAMTAEERQNPDSIGASEKQRIASKSDIRADEVDHFLKQFFKVRSLMQETANLTFWQRLTTAFGGRVNLLAVIGIAVAAASLGVVAIVTKPTAPEMLKAIRENTPPVAQKLFLAKDEDFEYSDCIFWSETFLPIKEGVKFRAAKGYFGHIVTYK